MSDGTTDHDCEHSLTIWDYVMVPLPTLITHPNFRTEHLLLAAKVVNTPVAHLQPVQVAVNTDPTEPLRVGNYL